MKNIHRPLAALAALALAALIPACGGKKEGVAGAYTYLPANSTVVGVVQVKKTFRETGSVCRETGSVCKKSTDDLRGGHRM